ncbi:MAG: tyrosine-type recombinase/integrase [Rhizobiales bacterium]|nr:tyrosine-type recombinase/integrase [Hyphomicrobiales bacterium]
MGVWKPKGSPYYQYEFQVDGARLRRTTKKKTKREAQIVAAQVLSDYLNHGGGSTKRRMTINEAFARYWDEKASQQKNAKTFDYQLENLRQGLGFVSKLGNDLCLHEINRPLVVAYREWRRVQASNREGIISPTSVNSEVKLFRTVLNVARDDWGALVDRDLSFKKIFLTEPTPRARALSSSEHARLREAVEGRDLAPVVQFSIVTTQRQQSVIRLKWSDVDYQARTVTFRDVKSKQEGKSHVLCLSSEMMQIIAPLRGDHPVYVFTFQCRRTNPRHGQKLGERYPFSQSGWRRDWRRILDAAVIQDFRWHDLRHTGATLWVRELGIAKAQRITGHADIQSLGRYSHLEMGDIAQAMERDPQTIPKKRMSG